MKFIMYSAVNADSIKASLGMPEYSYYFVLKELLPLFEDLGEVQLVKDPATEVDAIYRECQAAGQPCVFLSCSPPQKTEVGLACPTVSIFAWEFDNIPYESWDDDPRNDWRYVFEHHGRAISLSNHTARVVKATMGETFPIVAVPMPVWDVYSGVSATVPASGDLSVRGAVIDTRNYTIEPEDIQPRDPLSSFAFPPWDGDELEMAYTINDDFNSYLGGFYPAEHWGAWSKTRHPWVLVPRVLSGGFTLELDCAGYGTNAGRTIRVAVGNQEQELLLTGEYRCTTLRFDLDEPANCIRFLDLDYVQLTGVGENRILALGLRKITLSRLPGQAPLATLPPQPVPVARAISGVVYTSVFNPVDGRKNWTEILSAFCYAFRDVEDATLILKMTQKDITSFLGRLHHFLQLQAPFKCRVIALHGFLEDEDYQGLVTMTSYYVGASGGEGLCLPMMEYMSAGKPAISTCNTAMEDYIDEGAAFIVDSSLEPSFWPHDPRERLRTRRHRIDWYSLVQAFQASYDVARKDPERYRAMAANATENLRRFASGEVVKGTLRDFFELEQSDEDAALGN